MARAGHQQVADLVRDRAGEHLRDGDRVAIRFRFDLPVEDVRDLRAIRDPHRRAERRIAADAQIAAGGAGEDDANGWRGTLGRAPHPLELDADAAVQPHDFRLCANDGRGRRLCEIRERKRNGERDRDKHAIDCPGGARPWRLREK